MASSPPGLACHAAGIVSALFGLCHFGFGLGRGLSEPLGLPPLVVQDALELMLGMQHLEPHRHGHGHGSLLTLARRSARLIGQLHAPRKACARIGDDALGARPVRSPRTPALPRAIRTPLSYDLRHTPWLYRHQNRHTMDEDFI